MSAWPAAATRRVNQPALPARSSSPRVHGHRHGPPECSAAAAAPPSWARQQHRLSCRPPRQRQCTARQPGWQAPAPPARPAEMSPVRTALSTLRPGRTATSTLATHRVAVEERVADAVVSDRPNHLVPRLRVQHVAARGRNTQGNASSQQTAGCTHTSSSAIPPLPTSSTRRAAFSRAASARTSSVSRS